MLHEVSRKHAIQWPDRVKSERVKPALLLGYVQSDAYDDDDDVIREVYLNEQHQLHV